MTSSTLTPQRKKPSNIHALLAKMFQPDWRGMIMHPDILPDERLRMIILQGHFGIETHVIRYLVVHGNLPFP